MVLITLLFVGDHNVIVIVIVSLALAGAHYLLMFYDGSPPWWAVALCHYCHEQTVMYPRSFRSKFEFKKRRMNAS